jgi:hypothetical protein
VGLGRISEVLGCLQHRFFVLNVARRFVSHGRRRDLNPSAVISASYGSRRSARCDGAQVSPSNGKELISVLSTTRSPRRFINPPAAQLSLIFVLQHRLSVLNIAVSYPEYFGASTNLPCDVLKPFIRPNSRSNTSECARHAVALPTNPAFQRLLFRRPVRHIKQIIWHGPIFFRYDCRQSTPVESWSHSPV